MRFLEKVPVRVASMIQNSAEYFLIEIKPLFSIILTHLGSNGTTLPHTHPFNAWTFLLYGILHEVIYDQDGSVNDIKRLSAPAIKCTDGSMHSIASGSKGAWFLTFRGPWTQDTWQEERNGKLVTLTHGRKEI